MQRAMKDEDFREASRARLHKNHVVSLTELRDSVQRQFPDAYVPYFDPNSAGVNARVLTLARCPSPATNPESNGTGFVSLYNNDASAERHLAVVTEAGLDPATVLAWNAVPYEVPEGQPFSVADRKAGRTTIKRIVELLPTLRVIVIHGSEAKPVWNEYEKVSGVPYGVRVIATLATADRAFIGAAAAKRQKLADAYASVADALR